MWDGRTLLVHQTWLGPEHITNQTPLVLKSMSKAAKSEHLSALARVISIITLYNRSSKSKFTLSGKIDMYDNMISSCILCNRVSGARW